MSHIQLAVKHPKIINPQPLQESHGVMPTIVSATCFYRGYHWDLDLAPELKQLYAYIPVQITVS